MAKNKAKTTVAAKVSNYGKNKIAKLTKHLKKHPNDEQSNDVLKNTTTSSVSTRKASNSKMGWTTSNRELEATLRSKFTGSVTKAILVKHAQIISFSKKAPFNMVPVLVTLDNSPTYVFKHTSKLSNFKPKA